MEVKLQQQHCIKVIRLISVMAKRGCISGFNVCFSPAGAVIMAITPVKRSWFNFKQHDGFQPGPCSDGASSPTKCDSSLHRCFQAQFHHAAEVMMWRAEAEICCLSVSFVREYPEYCGNQKQTFHTCSHISHSHQLKPHKQPEQNCTTLFLR